MRFFNIEGIETGTVIGFVRLGKHVEHMVTSEVAAWGHTIQGDIGRFPVRLVNCKKQYHRVGCPSVMLVAEVPGTVSWSNYTSLFGGAAVGKSKINEMVGERESFNMSWGITALFNQSSDLMFHINPEFVEPIITALRNELLGSAKHDYESMTMLMQNLGEFCGSDGVVGKYEGKHDRRQAGMTAHYAGSIEKDLRLLAQIEDVCGCTETPTIDEIVEQWKNKWDNVGQMNNNDTFHSIDTENETYPWQEEVKA